MPLTPHARLRTALTVGGACLALVITSLSSVAAEYCVTCAEPAAMYACAVAGDAADSPPNARNRLVCIKELAKAGGHSSCSVPSSAPNPCPGVWKVVAAPADEPQAMPEPAGPAPDGTEPLPEDTKAAPAQKPKVPSTVEELAKQTVQSSKEGLQQAGEAVSDTAEKAGDQVGKAGSAVSNAARKTWDCVKSFFSDC